MGTEQVEQSKVDRKQVADGWWGQLKSTLEEHWFSYLLFMPALLFLVFLMWIPFIQGIWMSFHKWTFIEHQWLGLDNYRFLFEWDSFYTSMKATALFSTATFFQLVVALVAAVLVQNLRRFRNLTSGLMLIPYTMSPIVTGLIWVFLLNPDFGPILQYPLKWGIIDSTVYWDSSGALSLAAITAVTAWSFWPYMFIILLATLDNIPKSHYETARVYGANRVQTFYRITLPQLKSAIMIVVSLRMIWNLSKISQPLAMTGGGPGFDTSVLAILLYRYSWNRGAFGLAFAVGIILVTLTIAFTVLFITEFERESEVGAK